MKEILEMWNKEFPALKKYNSRSLFIIVKPFLMGLKLMKSYYGDNYRVFFTILPLWDKEDILNHRDLIFQELHDENNSQIFIGGRNREPQLERALTNVKRCYGNFMKGSVDINEFLSFIFKQRRKFLYSISPEEQIPIFKILFAIGLYYKNKSLTEYAVKLLNWETTLWQRIEYESGGFTFTEKVNGKTQKFIISDSILNVSYSGAKIEQIKQEILEDFKNREQFMRRIEENCKLSKISKLNVAEFVDIEEYKCPNLYFYDLSKPKLLK